MANLIKCKACGYVANEGSVRDKCPACGVPAKMFEPYIDPVSEKRRKMLDIHIHPVMVHFPQASAFSLFMLALLAFFAPPAIKIALVDTIKVISFFLPLFIIMAFLTGLFDGKIRFRRVTTPFLKIKMMIGGFFLLVSAALAALAFSQKFPASPTHEIFAFLTLLAAGCGMALGFIGGKLLAAKFPG
jgi:uncharacterized membrane protein/rubredoxin